MVSHEGNFPKNGSRKWGAREKKNYVSETIPQPSNLWKKISQLETGDLGTGSDSGPCQVQTQLSPCVLSVDFRHFRMKRISTHSGVQMLENWLQKRLFPQEGVLFLKS